MTIAIAVQVHDGIVLSSDSASTLSITNAEGKTEIINVYNNANKIFNLRKGLPIGGMTYGLGSFGASSISTLAKDLRRRFTGNDSAHKDWHLDPDAYTIEQVAVRAREFLYEEKFKPLGLKSEGATFGFLVAGYSAGAELSELWELKFVDGNCGAPTIVLPQGVANCYASGDPEAFMRIALGHGSKLGAALLKIGLKQENLASAITDIRAQMSEALVEAPMPIADAIDLAEFFVYATCMFTRFKRGAATVGGPVESVAITKHEGFKWVKRKHYFDDILNPRENDDVA
jgi:hypothetical protein